MGKRAKMCKALIAGLLAVTMAFTAQTGSTWKAEAAQFKGESFGVGFAGEEYATMHKADGWSNGDMFNCTWRADNVWFDGYLNLKIDRDYATGGYSGGEYRTNDTFGYGMYDVSMKAIKNDGKDRKHGRELVLGIAHAVFCDGLNIRCHATASFPSAIRASSAFIS